MACTTCDKIWSCQAPQAQGYPALVSLPTTPSCTATCCAQPCMPAFLIVLRASASARDIPEWPRASQSAGCTPGRLSLRWTARWPLGHWSQRPWSPRSCARRSHSLQVAVQHGLELLTSLPVYISLLKALAAGQQAWKRDTLHTTPVCSPMMVNWAIKHPCRNRYLQTQHTCDATRAEGLNASKSHAVCTFDVKMSESRMPDLQSEAKCHMVRAHMGRQVRPTIGTSDAQTNTLGFAKIW